MAARRYADRFGLNARSYSGRRVILIWKTNKIIRDTVAEATKKVAG
jgi:hypothetical protein